MKTFVKLLFFVACLGLLITCDKSNEIFEEIPDAELKSGEIHAVTLPFKANFTIYDYTDFSDERCGGYPYFYMVKSGKGKITHMGKVTVDMTFCFDASDFSYGGTECTFVAANGDELYATIPIGQVVANEGDNSDFYQWYFNDTIYFVGGTGKFMGAEGTAMSNAYSRDSDIDGHTLFLSSGEIILQKGKRKPMPGRYHHHYGHKKSNSKGRR